MPFTTAAYRGFGNGTIEWTIEGLEQPASAYDSFSISTSDGKFVSWSDGTNFDYTQNHACGTTVTGYGTAVFQGVSYSCGSASTYTENCAVPQDTRPPTISQTYDPRGTSIICSWSITDITNDSATDIESGFNRAYMFVGGADSYSPRTQVLTTYAAQSNFTCTTDGNGVAIAPNKTYTFHWEAYDNAGNWAVTSPLSVTTTMPRPPNFFWNPAVVSGQAYNMTANQWRFFQDQVNAFRGYKGFTPYAFSTVFAGSQPTANHYNEARNAIYSMNGNIPPFRNPGETIWASDYNGLQNSLNAVT